MKSHDLRFPGFLLSKPHALNTASDYENYANRIRKTLYYGRLPSTHRPSLPLTGLLVDKFGQFCKQDGFDQLNLHEASSICYDACVTPCSVIVALLYLDRLRTQNPDYLASTSPSQVFIVALMVASKYLYDDGEEDEVFNDEWASSAAMLLSDLNEAEKIFLSSIDWNLFVDVKSFMKGLLYVESTIAREQGNQRGFFVYSDMVTLSKSLPPVWTYFLNFVGSALVVCVVGYTAVVCVIVAGALVSRECAAQVAHQLHHNLLPTLPLTSCQPNSSNCCPLALEHCETVLKSSSWNEEETLSNQAGSELGEENDGNTVGSTSFSSRFGALRTLTTALLFASSSKFIDVPRQQLSHFSALDDVLGFCQTWFQSLGNVDRIGKNISFDDKMFLDEIPVDNQNSERLPRSRKLSRQWRKPRISTCTKETPNNTISQSFCGCDTAGLPTCCQKSSTKPLASMDLIKERTNLYAYLEYSYMIINFIEAFLHPKLSLMSVSECQSILRTDPELRNLSTLGRSSEHPPLFWTTEDYYSTFILQDETLNPDGPNFIPPWIWNSLLSFTLSRKNPEPVEVDWKSGNLAMVT